MEVKETKELVKGLLKLSALMAVSFKDGVQAQDVAEIFMKIQGDEALKAELLAAYNGADQVQAELKDISVAEALQIFAEVVPDLLKLIQAVSK